MGQFGFDKLQEPNPQKGVSTSGMNNSSNSPADLSGLNNSLAACSSLSDRLRLIAERVKGRIAFSTSLGLEDQALFATIVEAKLPFDVFTLDTGRQFPETYDTLSITEARYKRRIRVVFPDAKEVETLVARDGVLGFRESIENRPGVGQNLQDHWFAPLSIRQSV